MQQTTKVAVLGLGAMGHAFAANLLKNGFTVSGWNRTRARGEDLAQQGMTLCDSPADAVKDAGVVILMLSDAATTHQVTEQALSALRNGAAVVQMGTIGVEGTQRLITLLAARNDLHFFDAPVSGTKAPAENAQIVILASGNRAEAGRVEPVFAAISKAVKWQGEAGAGTRMKLVVNAWLIGMMQGLAESVQLAEELGFTPDDLWNTLDGGPLAAPYVKLKLDTISKGGYEPQMHLAWALKDARLALEAAGNRAMPGMSLIAREWQDAVDAGYGQKDLAVVYRYLGDRHR